MSIAIGVYFLAALLPSAITSFVDAETTNWSTSTIALWALVPLAIIAVIVFAYVPRGGRGGE